MKCPSQSIPKSPNHRSRSASTFRSVRTFSKMSFLWGCRSNHFRALPHRWGSSQRRGASKSSGGGRLKWIHLLSTASPESYWPPTSEYCVPPCIAARIAARISRVLSWPLSCGSTEWPTSAVNILRSECVVCGRVVILCE